MEPNDWIWAGGWRRKILEAAQEWLSEEALGAKTAGDILVNGHFSARR